jgi:hypothetical protein
MVGFIMLLHIDGLRWHDIHAKFHDGIGIQAILKLCLTNLRGCKADFTDGEIYEVGC